jgi:hypothetical protein
MSGRSPRQLQAPGLYALVLGAASLLAGLGVAALWLKSY